MNFGLGFSLKSENAIVFLEKYSSCAYIMIFFITNIKYLKM